MRCMKNFVVLAVAVMVLACISSQAVATVDVGTGWQSEYDGTEAGTLAMWNFNESEQYDMWGRPTQGVLPNQPGTGDKDWDLRYEAAATTLSFDAVGKWGEAMSQSGYTGGSSDERAIAYHGKELFPTATDPSLSVEFYVNFDDVTSNGGHQYLIDKGAGWNATSGYGIRMHNGDLKWSVGDGSTRMEVKDTWSPVNNQWYHIAGVWDADTDTSTLYVDGEVLATGSFAGKTIADDTSDILVIGNRSTSTYNSVDGAIDQARVGNVAYSYTPEPATMVILGLGSLMVTRRRRK